MHRKIAIVMNFEKVLTQFHDIVISYVAISVTTTFEKTKVLRMKPNVPVYAFVNGQ